MKRLAFALIVMCVLLVIAAGCGEELETCSSPLDTPEYSTFRIDGVQCVSVQVPGAVAVTCDWLE